MGKFKDSHGYSRFASWIANAFGISPGEIGSFGTNHLNNLVNSFTGAHMTGAQVEANELSMQNVHDQYSQQVSGMQDAGLNPALMYKGGAASSAPQASTSPALGMSDLMSLITLPLQMKMMKSQVEGQNIANEQEKVNLEFLRDEKTTALAYTSQQITNLQDQLKNNEVQRALNKIGISEKEANTALLVQKGIAESIDNETRGQLNELLLQYRAAEISYTNQKTEESKKAMDEIDARITELYSQCVLNAAQSKYYSAAEQSELESIGLIKLSKDEKQFTVDHQSADRVWKNALGTADAVGGLVRGAASFFGVGKLGQAAKAVKGLSPVAKERSLLYTDGSTQMFGNNYSR